MNGRSGDTVPLATVSLCFSETYNKAALELVTR